MLLLAQSSVLSLPWLFVIVAVVGGWLVLRLVASETKAAKAHLLAEHQRLLREQLAPFNRPTRL